MPTSWSDMNNIVYESYHISQLVRSIFNFYEDWLQTAGHGLAPLGDLFIHSVISPGNVAQSQTAEARSTVQLTALFDLYSVTASTGRHS